MCKNIPKYQIGWWDDIKDNMIGWDNDADHEKIKIMTLIFNSNNMINNSKDKVSSKWMIIFVSEFAPLSRNDVLSPRVME